MQLSDSPDSPDRRPAAPTSHTALRTGVSGAVAANVAAIVVYFAHQVVPGEIQGPVDELILTATSFLVGSLLGLTGSALRDRFLGARTLKRTPF